MAKLDEESGEDRLIATYFRPIATHPGAFGLTDDAAEPSRANAIRCLRSSALRKPPRIMPHPNPPIRKRQGSSADSSMSRGIN